MSSPRYSIIIPVFNRPQEIDELLHSLTQQTIQDFEVLVVEDGSTIRCDAIVDLYRDRLKVHYFFKPNTGPGPSRNFGYAQAHGEYFIVFDSDCIIPSGYLQAVEHSLRENNWDAWGGPDTAHKDFTPTQQAMGYTMSSFLTTGGIRGGKKRLGWFQPRSFNMGISRNVFEKTRGFAFDRYAEDIEFSVRMKKGGFKVGLIPEAFVFHKRRTTFEQFYRQVSNFGKGRAMVGKVHPDEVKATHWFPTLFVAGILFIPLLIFINLTLFKIATLLVLVYLISIFLHALATTKNLHVACLAVPAAIMQLWGYGTGFLKERIKPHAA